MLPRRRPTRAREDIDVSMSRSQLLLAALACTAFAALGWLLAQRRGPAGPARVAETACDCGTAAMGSPAGAIERAGRGQQPLTQPAEGTVEAPRFAVCEREETRAALSRVPLLDAEPELWALHCGRSVHLIAVEALGGTLVPRRVALLQAPSAGPGEAPAAVETAAADVNGDGRADWVAPVLLADSRGVPRGGGLYVLGQRAEGGFDSPVRILAAAPGAVVAAELDGQPARDLVLLQRHDATTARADELWLIHGGPAPLRAAQRPAGVGTTAIAALDLDLDRRDDLAAASAREGRVRLWLSRGGALAQIEPIEMMVPGVEQLLPADLDGDGTRELVLAGERTWSVTPRSDAPVEAVAIAGSEGLRDLHFADATGDGQPELVGYAHPDLLALARTGDHFERSRVLSLRGEVSVVFARVTQLDRDPRPDVLMVVLATGAGSHVELSLAANVAPGTTLRFAAGAAPIADAALLQRFVSP
jgi:hypothetical protein